MADNNDYGKFETFYKPEPQEKQEWWRDEEPKVPEDRPNPFTLVDLRGSAAYQKTT